MKVGLSLVGLWSPQRWAPHVVFTGSLSAPGPASGMWQECVPALPHLDLSHGKVPSKGNISEYLSCYLHHLCHSSPVQCPAQPGVNWDQTHLAAKAWGFLDPISHLARPSTDSGPGRPGRLFGISKSNCLFFSDNVMNYQTKDSMLTKIPKTFGSLIKTMLSD